MEQIITHPAQVLSTRTHHVNIDVDNKIATVTVLLFNGDVMIGDRKIQIDIRNMMDNIGFTPGQKQVIKTFFESLIANAWGIATNELTSQF